jgi:hypothetical protein
MDDCSTASSQPVMDQLAALAAVCRSTNFVSAVDAVRWSFDSLLCFDNSDVLTFSARGSKTIL